MGGAGQAARAGKEECMASGQGTVRSSNRREEVIRVAAELIGRNGLDGVSMRDIAKAVGMLPGSLYYHFPSKEDLFLEIHAQAVARFHETLDDALEGVEPPWARLEAAMRAHLRQLLSSRNLVAIVSPDAAGGNAELTARMVAERDRYDARIRALVEALKMPPDVDRRLFRLMLMGAMNWTPVWYRETGMAPEEIADAFLHMLRRPMQG